MVLPKSSAYALTQQVACIFVVVFLLYCIVMCGIWLKNNNLTNCHVLNHPFYSLKDYLMMYVKCFESSMLYFTD